MANRLTDRRRLSHRLETREQLWGPGTPFSSLRLDGTAHVPWSGEEGGCAVCVQRTDGETRSQAGQGGGQSSLRAASWGEGSPTPRALLPGSGSLQRGTEQAPRGRGGPLGPSSRAGRGRCSDSHHLRSKIVASAGREAVLGLTWACRLCRPGGSRGPRWPPEHRGALQRPGKASWAEVGDAVGDG